MTRTQASSKLNASSPEKIAAQWVAREVRGRLKPAERKELDAWLASNPAHREAFKKAEAVYKSAGEAASHPDILAMRSAALTKVQRISPSVVWGAALAASALVAIGLAIGLPNLPDNPATTPRAVANVGTKSPSLAQMLDHYATRIGERLSATLEDGSVISLNTDSEVRIDYSPKARRIELVRGEAMFDVAHRPDWPFEVAAGDRVVRALGTVFNVRRRGANLEVVLIEGHVAVGKADRIEAGDLSKAIQLEAGEKLLASTAAVHVAAVDAEAATNWRQGRLSFESTPLRDVIAEVNRYRTTPLAIEDPRVAALQLSGTYRTADAMTFEDALAAALNVDTQTSSAGIVLLWRKGNVGETRE